MCLLTPYIVKSNSIVSVGSPAGRDWREPAGRPIDIVSNLFDPPIYLSKPSAVATSPFSELFCQQGYYFGK